MVAVVCIGFSVLFLVFVGTQEAHLAQDRATSDWNLVLPLIKEGRLPAVLPNGAIKGQIQVLDAQNHVVAATRQLVGKPPISTVRMNRDNVRIERTLCSPAGLKGCMTIVSFKIFSQPGGNWLINVAVPSVPWYGSSGVLFLAIGVSLLMTTMTAVGVSRAVGKTLAPVDAIRTELAEITATGLHRRVPVPANQNEIRLLAETANATLDRLEGAYRQLRQFTSDASHDLRNPITAMRAQVEEALMYPDDTNWQGTLKTLLVDIDRLQAIVNDLLNLARLDAGAPLNLEACDLGQLVGVELDRRTRPKQIVKALSHGVVVNCDRLRIARLLANLVDNAERHAASQITVSVRAEGSTATLEVLDDGAGIAVEQREMVFDRFTRLEASRDRDAGGTGLGLAIARQIAEAHHGTLTIEDSTQGARFVLRLPLPDPSPAP